MEKAGVIFSIVLIVFTIFSLPHGFFNSQSTITAPETTTSVTQPDPPATTFVTVKPTTITLSPTVTTMFTTKTVTTVQTTSLKTTSFSDDFSQWQNVWSDEYDGNLGEKFYSNGQLHIIDLNPPVGGLAQRLHSYYSNFILDLDIIHIDGTINNWMCVETRENGDDESYEFCISSTGYYSILKFVKGQKTTFVSPRKSNYILSKGLTNHMTVECNNNNLILKVNGHQLETVKDSSFSGGSISLSATAMDSSSTEVVFDNLKITTL